MSALNVVKQRDRVILVTDGAVWDVNAGVLQGFPAKQATMPSLPAVFATRGAPLATPVFAHLLGLRFQSFDAMIAGIENELPDIHARVRFLCRGNVDEPIVIAGWSRERNRPEAYTIRTSEDISATTMEGTLEEAILPPVYKNKEKTFAEFVARYPASVDARTIEDLNWDDDLVGAQKKALAEHVACHPEDAGRTVKDFNWLEWEIVQHISTAEIQRQKSQRQRRGMKLPRAKSKTIRSMGARAPMVLPRRPSPFRRLIRLASLARNHGGPCTNVLLGISADRRGRNGNDDPARPR